MRSHVSGLLPKAFESRIAIWGLIADLQVTTLFSAWRVTPRTFAACVMVSPKGSMQSCRTMRPEWTGFFMGMFVSAGVDAGRVYTFQQISFISVISSIA